MKMRPLLFWLHLAVGIIAGAVILSMAISGMLIAYERQMMGWMDRDIRTVQVPDNASRHDIGELLKKTQQSNPGIELASLTLYSDPGMAMRVAAGRDGVFFVNPYTGEFIKDPNRAAREFFHGMTDWHRWLGQEGKGKEIGKAVTGSAALCFLFLLISGMILWIPRIWSSASLRAIGLLDRSLKGKARDWNWHNVWGIWAAPVLLVVTLTGIIMAYTWATRLLYTITGNEPPPERRREQAGPGRTAASPINTQGLDALVELAQRQWPDWQSIQFRIPHSAKEPVTFNLDAGDGTRPDRRAQLGISRPAGKIVSWEPYETWNAGRKLRSWARPIHTGEAGGFLGQLVAVFGACSAAVLVWTGFSLGFRRLASFHQRRKNAFTAAP